MSKDNVIDFKGTLENEFKDALTDFIRATARSAIQEGVEAEIKEFMESFKDLTLENGKQQVVRNGYNPERNLTTSIGNLNVKMPKVRDRKKTGIAFTSALIPPYICVDQKV